MSGVPPGSRVVMSPSAYMTDEVWEKIAPGMAKGIRSLPVVCDRFHAAQPFTGEENDRNEHGSMVLDSGGHSSAAQSDKGMLDFFFQEGKYAS